MMVLGLVLVVAGCGEKQVGFAPGGVPDAGSASPTMGEDAQVGDAGVPDVGVPDVGPEPPPASGDFTGLPTGRTQWALLCARQHRDAISSKFCAGDAPPRVTSIAELETFLGLTIRAGVGGNADLVLTGMSTGLGIRRTTPLNPRAVVMTHVSELGLPNDPLEVISFGRGEPFVELVANDRDEQTLRFFALRFNPACEFTAAGCNFADLLTPAFESGWLSYTLYDEETLKNTTVDCLVCHQPAGPGTQKILRMQELVAFWDHWFDAGYPGLAPFHAAHGTESYAGFPSAELASPGPGILYRSSPAALQNLMLNNGFAQPNAFDSPTINDELLATGVSPTWQALYAKAVAGLEIPPPYFAQLQTDPAKVAAMVTAYQQVMAGTMPREQLPDIRDTLLDAALPDMSIRPKRGLDGRGILVHMCAMCHDSRLDPTLSRARFNVEQLDAMPREEKDLAIARLRLDDSDIHKMPPVRLHVLVDAERDLAIQELAR